MLAVISSICVLDTDLVLQRSLSPIHSVGILNLTIQVRLSQQVSGREPGFKAPTTLPTTFALALSLILSLPLTKYFCLLTTALRHLSHFRTCSCLKQSLKRFYEGKLLKQ